MSDEELIEIGETAVGVLGSDALDKLADLEDLLAEHSPAEIRRRLERLEQLEDRLENLEESVDLNQLRDVAKRLKAARASAEKLEEALAAAVDDLLRWMTDMHAAIQ